MHRFFYYYNIYFTKIYNQHYKTSCNFLFFAYYLICIIRKPKFEVKIYFKLLYTYIFLKKLNNML